MIHYKITLKPLGSFYFGNERNFGIGENANYFVHSRYFPQQTSLLGLIRYQILQQKQAWDKAGKLHSDASQWIGKHSFTLEKRNEDQGYGYIEYLSPLWLEVDGEPYFVAPKNHGFNLRLAERGQCISGPLGSASLQEQLPLLSNEKGAYDAKKNGVSKLLLNAGGKKKKWDETFCKEVQVGIKKDSAEKDSGGFFRQTRYRFPQKGVHAFGCKLSLSDQAGKLFGDSGSWLVRLGGDQSSFLMEVELLDSLNPQKPFSPEELPPLKALSDYHQVYLLSEAYVPQDWLPPCDFALTESPVDFRYLKTSVSKTKRYYNVASLKKRKNETSRDDLARLSNKYQLLPRGSVLFVKKEAQPTEEPGAFLDRKGMQRIGYNHYVVSQ